MQSDVAFVIPARNAAATLPMTMESVIAQTNGSWEAIIVDGDSTDDTPAQIFGWVAHEPKDPQRQVETLWASRGT